MLRAIGHRHGDDNVPFGTVVLDHAERHLRRKMITTNQGDKIMVDLPEPLLFADGDVLVLEDGRTVEIIAAKEKLYAVTASETCPVRHLAWHLGNRHLAAQIDAERILIQRDHVIKAMLEGLGATVTEVVERFQPVHGAYHNHGDPGHAGAAADHGHAHGHRHDDHGHGHGHDHAEAKGRGKRDKFGRLPGDPHYGHNHG